MSKGIPHECHHYDRVAHEAFVHSSWTSGSGEPRETLSAMLRRPDVACLVASLAGHPNDLLGWAVARAGRLVWVYVRSAPGIRRQGIARALIARLGLPSPIRCLYWPQKPPGLVVAEKMGFVYAPSAHNQKRGAA